MLSQPLLQNVNINKITNNIPLNIVFSKLLNYFKHAEFSYIVGGNTNDITSIGGIWQYLAKLKVHLPLTQNPTSRNLSQRKHDKNIKFRKCNDIHYHNIYCLRLLSIQMFISGGLI